MATEADRGVSTLIGFIILFGFLVISFSVYQGMVVPDQNRATEFEHNKHVQSQMQELRNGIVSAAYRSSDRAVAIQLAAEYPSRTFARNLGISSGGIGTFEFEGGSNFSIDNATATDLFGETNDFWNGTQHNYTTKGFLYRPVYSFYSNPPQTVYENSLLYNHFGQGDNVSITEQSLIEGNQITLVALTGNVSRSSQETVSVDLESVSASSTSVSVVNSTADNNVNITIPTRLNKTIWKNLLEEDGELTPSGHVKHVNDTGPNQVSFVLNQSDTYRLRMAKVGVGSGVTEENPAYLTLNNRPSGTVLNDSSHLIELEVRDRFNNPIAGETIDASSTNGGDFEVNSKRSNSEGIAVFNYTAPSGSTNEDQVVFDIDGSSAPAKNVTFNMSIREYP